MTLHTLNALPGTYILACEHTRAGYTHAYKIMGWQSVDGITWLPVAICAASINEQLANANGNPLSAEWDIGAFNKGAEVITADDERTLYHVERPDTGMAWEEIDNLRAAHYSYQ